MRTDVIGMPIVVGAAIQVIRATWVNEDNNWCIIAEDTKGKAALVTEPWRFLVPQTLSMTAARSIRDNYFDMLSEFSSAEMIEVWTISLDSKEDLLVKRLKWAADLFRERKLNPKTLYKP